MDVYAEGLGKVYPNGVWGIRRVDLSCRRGEVLALLGPNGAGKTTTIKILATLLRPTYGRAYVMGLDVVREAERVRRHIALMPQGGYIDRNWTPYYAVKWYLVSRGYSLRDAEREARRWLEEMGLWELRDRSGWALSGGEARRVLATMVMASGAEVVFLDEPSSGMDIESRYVLWGVVRRRAREGSCVIYTSHDMREVENVADRVLFINRGLSIPGGSPRELIERFPYRYKISVRGAGVLEGMGTDVLRLGDETRIYARDRREVLSVLERLGGLGDVYVREVDLEDVYLSVTREVV